MLAVFYILVVPAHTLTHCVLTLLISAWDYHRKIPLATDRGGVLEDVLGLEDVLEDTFSSPWPWPRRSSSWPWP